MPGRSSSCCAALPEPAEDRARRKNAGWKPRMRRQIVAWRREPQVSRCDQQGPLDFLGSSPEGATRRQAHGQPLAGSRLAASRHDPVAPVQGLGRIPNCQGEVVDVRSAGTWGSRHQATTCCPLSRLIISNGRTAQQNSNERVARKTATFHRPRPGLTGRGFSEACQARPAP